MLLIYAITVTGITVNTLVAPGIPDILDGLGVSRGLAGLIVASATFPGIFLAPTVGVLADRYGRREVLVPCLTIFGVAGGLVVFAPSLWVLVALRILQGAGSAGLINLAVVLIGDHWDGTERVRRIGRNSAVLTVCIAVFPAIGGFLTDLGGWRAPFGVYPVALATVWFVLRHLPPTPSSDVRVSDQLREALVVLRTPALLVTIGTGIVLFILIFGLLLTVMPIYIEERFGLGAGSRGLIMGLPAVAATSAALSLGRIRERMAMRWIVVVASVLFTAALAMVAGAPTLLLLGFGVLVFGLGEGLMIPSLQDVAAGTTSSSRGTVVAVWVGSARLGQTLGPLIAGAGLSLLGAGGSFAAGAVVAGALTVVLAAGARWFR